MVEMNIMLRVELSIKQRTGKMESRFHNIVTTYVINIKITIIRQPVVTPEFQNLVTLFMAQTQPTVYHNNVECFILIDQKILINFL